MNLIFRTKSYLRFLLKAKPASGYGIHSPFIFHFATEVVLPAKSKKLSLQEIEQLRKKLSNDNRILYVEDFGTGKSGKRKVKRILTQSSSSDKINRLLFQVIKEYKPASVLELGTNLGLSAASMALANSDIPIITIEGSQSIADVARENFENEGLTNILLITGKFEDKLVPALDNIKKPFVAFVDGNHRYEATIKYFDIIANAADNNSLIIIDDIHNSEEMHKAWKEICNHPDATSTVDLFQLGIVFFRHGLPKMNTNILF